MYKQIRKIRGGIIVQHNKFTANSATTVMPIPEYVEIPMSQHIGASCNILVKKGDYVYAGQIIGDSPKYVSVPVHSSVSGTVKEIRDLLFPNGSIVASVVIESDGLQTLDPSITKPDISNLTDFLSAVRKSGLSGLGGAGFPTHVKLDIKDKKADHLIINAAECEPYITCDYRAIIEESGKIIAGIKLVMSRLSIPTAYIGIEDNKQEAIRKLNDLLKDDKAIQVVSLKSRYPQGAEKMLIYSLTGRKVPMGGLPMDVNVIVMNVTTVLNLETYCETGIPLISKRITVDGDAVRKRGNYSILIGTYIKDVFDFADGKREDVAKILYGGPMMGTALKDMEMPVLKQNNALLFLSKEQSYEKPESNCIRCGRCIEACPMGLMPLNLNRYSAAGNVEDMEKNSIMNCIECGACSYVCPAKRYLVQSIRIGKEIVKKSKVKNG
ncbi:MAG: electron transport complex subunit RsxC [Clostridia bacterium]|jgi:electron transport complex protein RnfC